MESNKPVLITSIFAIPTLPKLPLTTRQDSSTRKAQYSLKTNAQYTSKLTTEPSSRYSKTEDNSRNRMITEHFKDKLYEDVSLQSLAKLKHKIAFNDKFLVSKVLHMKKFISFWKCFCDYANPIISIEKFKNESKVINARHNKDVVSDLGQEVKYKPTLFTNSSIFEYNHKRKKVIEKEFYDKIRYNGFLI